jgi:GntR family transcriptional regulator
MSVNPRDPGSSGSFTRVKAAAPQESGFGYRPLYRQVKDVLLKRLAEGSWAAGEILPSEPEIAAGLGVSPGTVRKALDELTAENLLVRRQGRGTFVARHDEERILFQFFRLISDTGERRFPESRVLAVSVKPAAADVAEALGLASGTPVTTIERVRSIDDVPCIHEFIALPAALFPGMEARSNLPNNLYAMFAADYGVTVARASERLKAIVAGVRQAELLETADGEALLAVDRLAFGLDGQPVEWRRSLCRTDRWHYASDLK